MRRLERTDLVIAAVTAPCVVAAAIVLTRDWYPVSDWALLEVQAFDVYSAHPPSWAPTRGSA